MSVKCSSVQPFSVSQLCRALSARSWAWVRCAIPPSNSAPTLCSRHPVSNRCQRSAISPTRIWHVGDGSRASRKRQRIRDSIGDSANASARGISHLSRMTSRSPACSIDAAASSSRCTSDWPERDPRSPDRRSVLSVAQHRRPYVPVACTRFRRRARRRLSPEPRVVWNLRVDVDPTPRGSPPYAVA